MAELRREIGEVKTNISVSGQTNVNAASQDKPPANSASNTSQEAKSSASSSQKPPATSCSPMSTADIEEFIFDSPSVISDQAKGQDQLNSKAPTIQL